MAPADVIVSPSGGGSGEVRVFDGTDGTELARVRAFGKGSGGVRVAAGDVNGDGRAEIIAGSGLGSTARIFEALSGGLLPGNDSEFRAFGKNFRGGIYVAAGDVNGDGRDDVIASTSTDGKTFRIFESGKSRSNFDDADAYPGALRGVRVATVDANSDGIADIITAKARGDARVTIFDGITHERLFRLSGYPTNFLGGVFVG